MNARKQKTDKQNCLDQQQNRIRKEETTYKIKCVIEDVKLKLY